MRITCPRCRHDVDEDLYGPCGSCRAELRATMGADRRDIDAGRFVPKMNVTPNAVALKE